MLKVQRTFDFQSRSRAFSTFKKRMILRFDFKVFRLASSNSTERMIANDRGGNDLVTFTNQPCNWPFDVFKPVGLVRVFSVQYKFLW